MSKDVVFTKGTATKTLPECYTEQLVADGWKVKGGAPDLNAQLATAAKKAGK